MSPKKGPNQKKMSQESKDVLLHYGSLIHKYRKNSLYSRSDVCEKVDISNSQLSTWESGKAEPRLHSMLKICELLNIPLEELFFDVKSREMTAEELKIIKMLRNSPETIRKQIIGLIGAITNNSGKDVDTHSVSVASVEPDAPLDTTDCSFPKKIEATPLDDEEPIIDEDLFIDHEENSAISNEEPTTPVRKRGRPPKAKNENITGEEKDITPLKKRGRPKKDTTKETEKSQDISAKKPSKRENLRKAANETDNNQSEPIVEAALSAPANETTPIKRKRGRPRKISS